MCGILGGISAEPFAFLDIPGALDRVIDVMAHRGPDDRGAWISADRCAFLGHRRLSIIDPAGGRQPLADESGRRLLCYNGEIYNYRRLREQLFLRGHRFRTRVDGETIVHLYEEDPHGFTDRLQGMFALAVYDQPTRRLTLARDRNGIKPLYYWREERGLLFASEIKGLLELLPARPPIDPRALREYLRWKYIPAPRTIYRGILELPPASVLTACAASDGRGLSLELRRYWDPSFDTRQEGDLSEAADELDRLLRAAVEAHMESDVEVGALLSGGVDSSLVVSIASQVSRRPIRTFSVGFREPGFDQLPFARTLARHCRTEHHEEYVDLDPIATVPALVRCFDQPFADSSALACYRVCEVAARHVKVALTGDGGDESFAGYRRYADLRDAAGRPAWRRRLGRLVMAAGAALLPDGSKLLRPLRGAGDDPLDGYRQRERLCGEALIGRLLTGPYRAPEGEDDAFGEVLSSIAGRGWSAVEAAQYVDSRMYLPGDILTKVDRTSMAWSLECRPPLLDHTISEFAASLPIDWKIREGQAKYLLKRVADRYVPRELIYRKKRGFRVPIRRWFKGELLDRTAGLLRGGMLVSAGILEPTGIEWVLRAQRRAGTNLASLLWALLFLEYWAREYLGNARAGAPAC